MAKFESQYIMYYSGYMPDEGLHFYADFRKKYDESHKKSYQNYSGFRKNTHNDKQEISR